MIGTSSNLLGVGLGFYVPKLFIDEYSDHEVYTDDQKQRFSDQIRTMCIWISIVASVIAVLVIVTFKEKPLTPPPQDLTIECAQTDNSQDVIETLGSSGAKPPVGSFQSDDVNSQRQSDQIQMRKLGFGDFDKTAYK